MIIHDHKLSQKQNPVQKGQNRRKGEEEWITEKSSTLVHLFHEIQKLEEEAIITEDFKDLTNNDMHIIESRRPGGRQYVIDRGKARHHGRIADNVDEQSGEKRLHRAGAQREGPPDRLHPPDRKGTAGIPSSRKIPRADDGCRDGGTRRRGSAGARENAESADGLLSVV